MIDTMSQESITAATSINGVDYHSIIVNGINEWCLENRHDQKLINLKLIEGTDYLLTIPSNNLNSAHIHCDCRASARLPRQGNNFQLSNYYQHLKSGKCSMLQSKSQSNSFQGNDTHHIIDTIEASSFEPKMSTKDTQTLSFDSNSSVRSKRTTTSSNHLHSKTKRQREFI